MQHPTFVTVWLGANDVLGAATSGIVIDGVTLTTRATFSGAYRTILGAVAQSGAQMAVANVPDVTALPYVSTIPPFVVNPATRQPVLDPNGNFIPLIGPNGPMSLGDKVLLPASALLAKGIGIPVQLGGTGQPLPDSVHLSRTEVTTIRQRTLEINDVIQTAAGDFGAALVDIHAFFDDIVAHGYPVAGGQLTYTTAFLTGGIFSYDGVHPTPFAYAVVANLFIDAINSRFNDDIPPVDLLPFAFGPDGSAGATIPLPGLGNGSPVFASSAYESLRTSLGVPTTAQLEKLKNRGRRHAQPMIPHEAPVRPLHEGRVGQLKQ